MRFAVVGLGAAGAAALYHLARAGTQSSATSNSKSGTHAAARTAPAFALRGEPTRFDPERHTESRTQTQNTGQTRRSVPLAYDGV